MCNALTYRDLGKTAKDVFNEGYGFRVVKRDLRTKSCSRVELSTSSHAYTDTGKASGNLETKYKVCNYRLTFTQKWNTDNTPATKISLENKLAEELKQTLDTIFVPNTGKKSGKLKASYKRDCHKVGLGFELESFFFKIIYSLEIGRDTGRGRSRLPSGSLMQDSIPGPQDHHLNRRQTLNH
uniref:Non-selective voltage-gated ion channel VDAC3 n=2 Tax=Canis lupus familiaris TaxID=9615 RepID=A0A8C0YWV2_CANLF